MKRLTLLFSAIICLWLNSAVTLAAPAPPVPGPKDKCPVCGMFVHKYPAWTAAIRFSDGSRAWFDGTKDLFNYLNNLSKYAPNRKPAMISAIEVKDYYSLKLIDGKTAFYVIGSNVYGPMGHELVPFVKQGDAQEFLKDHAGKRIVRYHDITPALLKTLE